MLEATFCLKRTDRYLQRLVCVGTSNKDPTNVTHFLLPQPKYKLEKVKRPQLIPPQPWFSAMVVPSSLLLVH